jgi:hypothetical protein
MSENAGRRGAGANAGVAGVEVGANGKNEMTRNAEPCGYCRDMSEDDHVELPIHEWPGPEADALRKSLEHITDLQHVVACCDVLLQMPTDYEGPLTQALFESAVITYARCFNSGRRSKITEQALAASAADEAVVWHRYFMKLRDQHVAHTVLPHAHLSIGVVVSAIGAEPFRVLGSGYLTVRRVSDDEEGLQALRGLALELIRLHADPVEGQEAALVKSASAAGEAVVRAQPLVSYTVPGTEVRLNPPSER